MSTLNSSIEATRIRERLESLMRRAFLLQTVRPDDNSSFAIVSGVGEMLSRDAHWVWSRLPFLMPTGAAALTSSSARTAGATTSIAALLTVLREFDWALAEWRRHPSEGSLATLQAKVSSCAIACALSVSAIGRWQFAPRVLHTQG